MNPRTHKHNNLTFSPDKLEDRILFSASNVGTQLPAVASPTLETIHPLRASIPTAPTLVRSLQSINTLEVQSRSTTLRVQATDDQGESTLVYSWSAESAPAGGNVVFSTNSSNQAKNVVVRFDRVGTYTLRVDISDRQGNKFADRVQVQVRPVATGLTLVQPDVSMTPGRAATVSVASARFSVVVRDQFGNSMTAPQGIKWKVDGAPAGSQTSFNAGVNDATLTLDRQGTYRISASVGRFSVVSRFDAVPQLSRVDILHDGKRIEPGSTLATTTLNQRFTIQGFDQFGQRWTQPTQWTWSAKSPTAGATANISSTFGKASLVFNQTGTYALVVSNGGVSNAFTVQAAVSSQNTNNSTNTNTSNNNTNTASTGAIVGRTIHVANQAELTRALSLAVAGDTILLQGGVNYGDLKIYKPAKPFTGTVTIRSANPNDRAILSSIGLSNTQNVTIADVRVVTLTRFAAISISGSKSIVIKNSEVTANLDPYRADQSLRRGVDLRSSTDITFQGNSFYRLSSAFGVGTSSNVLIEGNTFRENLLDNLNLGSNISEVIVRGNTLYSQVAKLFPDHHYDNIQLWVQTDATQNSRNISITHNSIYDLTGVVKSQAIFGRGDYVDEQGVENPYGFENLEISHNVIVTQQANAISISDARGLRIQNNTLVYGGDSRAAIASVTIPGIGANKSTDVIISNNILPWKTGYPATESTQFHNNTFYEIASGNITDLLVNPYSLQPTRDDFATLKTSSLQNADGSYRGAFTLTSQSQRPTALFTYSRQIRNGQFVYTLDGAASLAATNLDLKDATFHWQFADGTNAVGVQIEKSFGRAGAQPVTLTVTDRLGQKHSFVKEGIIIRDTNVIAANFDGSLADSTYTSTAIQSMGKTTFVPRSNGGSAIALGGEQGHIYVAPSDPDLSEMTATRQLTIAASIQANAGENTSALPLFTRHGIWSLNLQPNGSLRFSAGSSTSIINPSVTLLDGNWNEVAMTVTSNSFSLFINGIRVHNQQLTSSQSDAFFQARGYGIGIGGSGPWASNRAGTKFQLDNLVIGTAALTDQQIAAIALRNSLLS